MSKIFSRHSVIIMFLCFFVLCFAIGLYVWMRVDLRDKEAQLAALQQELAEVQMDNDSISYLINEADANELYEHLARERGYVYPDEKVYYDVTPGN